MQLEPDTPPGRPEQKAPGSSARPVSWWREIIQLLVIVPWTWYLVSPRPAEQSGFFPFQLPPDLPRIGLEMLLVLLVFLITVKRSLVVALVTGKTEPADKSRGPAGRLMRTVAPFTALAVLVVIFRADLVLQPHRNWWLFARLLVLVWVCQEDLISGVLYRRYGEVMLAAYIVVAILRVYVFQQFNIPTGSMTPTLLPGDWISVNRMAWRFGQKPRRGDVIVFKFPGNPRQDFVKRVAAGENDTVEIRNKRLIVNNRVVPTRANGKYRYERVFQDGLRRFVECGIFREYDTYDTLIDPSVNCGHRLDYGPEKVPPGHVFVLGDNRDDSADSRAWSLGPFLDMRLVKGKAFLVYWPLSRMGLIPQGP